MIQRVTKTSLQLAAYILAAMPIWRRLDAHATVCDRCSANFIKPPAAAWKSTSDNTDHHKQFDQREILRRHGKSALGFDLSSQIGLGCDSDSP